MVNGSAPVGPVGWALNTCWTTAPFKVDFGAREHTHEGFLDLQTAGDKVHQRWKLVGRDSQVDGFGVSSGTAAHTGLLRFHTPC